MSIYEKSMLTAIISRQVRDYAVFLSHAQIGEMASMSTRTVIRLEPALESQGLLEVRRRRDKSGELISGLAYAYRVIQVQGELFEESRGTGSAKLVGNPVQRGGAASTAPIPPVTASHTHSPPPTTASHTLSESASGTSKPKTRAEVRPRDPSHLLESEQKRRIEARSVRIDEEIEILRGSLAGAGPGAEQYVAETLRKITERMRSLEPLTQKQFEARRREQLAQLKQRR